MRFLLADIVSNYYGGRIITLQYGMVRYSKFLLGMMIIMMFIRMVSYNVDVGGNEEEYWE